MGGGLQEPLPRNRAERRERRHRHVMGITTNGAVVHSTRRHPALRKSAGRRKAKAARRSRRVNR